MSRIVEVVRLFYDVYSWAYPVSRAAGALPKSGKTRLKKWRVVVKTRLKKWQVGVKTRLKKWQVGVKTRLKKWKDTQ